MRMAYCLAVGASLCAGQAPATQSTTGFRGYVFPIRYPSGVRQYGLVPEGYERLPNGAWRATSAVNRFRMLIPPIGLYVRVSCRMSAGAARPFGHAWWQRAPFPVRFGPGSGITTGGIGVDTPQAGGSMSFTIDNRRYGVPGPDHLESIWIVAPMGTVFEYCAVSPIRPSGRAVRSTP